MGRLTRPGCGQAAPDAWARIQTVTPLVLGKNGVGGEPPAFVNAAFDSFQTTDTSVFSTSLDGLTISNAKHDTYLLGLKEGMYLATLRVDVSPCSDAFAAQIVNSLGFDSPQEFDQNAALTTDRVTFMGGFFRIVAATVSAAWSPGGLGSGASLQVGLNNYSPTARSTVQSWTLIVHFWPLTGGQPPYVYS